MISKHLISRHGFTPIGEHYFITERKKRFPSEVVHPKINLEPYSCYKKIGEAHFLMYSDSTNKFDICYKYEKPKMKHRGGFELESKIEIPRPIKKTSDADEFVFGITGNHPIDVLEVKVKYLGLSVRTLGVLLAADVDDINEILHLGESQLLRFRNMGKGGIEEIKEGLKSFKIKFRDNAHKVDDVPEYYWITAFYIIYKHIIKPYKYNKLLKEKGAMGIKEFGFSKSTIKALQRNRIKNVNELVDKLRSSYGVLSSIGKNPLIEIQGKFQKDLFG